MTALQAVEDGDLARVRPRGDFPAAVARTTGTEQRMTAGNAVAVRQEAQITDLRPVDAGQLMFEVLSKGDLANLSDEEIARYEVAVCRSVGLNPLTKPFDVITLPGKDGEPGRKVLYANRNAGDQLCGIHKITREIVKREVIDGVYVVTARASTADGRFDESIGAVPLMKEGGAWKTVQVRGENKRVFESDGTFAPLSPDLRANKMMHAETKAKRRAVLSLVGLSFLDESELDTMGELGGGSRVSELRAPTLGAELASLGTGLASAIAANHPVGNATPERKAAADALGNAIIAAYGVKAADAKQIGQDLLFLRFGYETSLRASVEDLVETREALERWGRAHAGAMLEALRLIGSAANATMATDVAITLEEHGIDDIFVLQALSDALTRFEDGEEALARVGAAVDRAVASGA